MKTLVLDNYDSFTYNLVHIIEDILQEKVDVYRNDEITLEEVAKYDKIILSPGPGIPEEAGIMKDLIRRYGAEKPIFGVCLGEQAIGEVYGAKIENLNEVHHGISSPMLVLDKDEILFDGMGDSFEGGRYHSWIVSKTDFPSELKITSEDENGQIMAIRHSKYNVCGVQFHPESVLTDNGARIIENFLKS
jgi:anthranilate synthase component 2